MIACKSQEDLPSYQFRSTAARDLITSKTLAEHGARSKPPPESCWERMKKWGRRLQTITCSKSKVAHQRIGIHESFRNYVKVKVICILHDDPASRPCVGFSASLIFANVVQIFIYNVVTLIWHVFFFPHISSVSCRRHLAKCFETGEQSTPTASTFTLFFLIPDFVSL